MELEDRITIYQDICTYLQDNPTALVTWNFKTKKLVSIKGKKLESYTNFLPFDKTNETPESQAVYFYGMTMINIACNGIIKSMKTDKLKSIIEGVNECNLFDGMKRIEASLAEQCIFKNPKRRIQLKHIANHPLFSIDDIYPQANTKINEGNPVYNKDHKVNSTIQIAEGGFGYVYLVLKTPKNELSQHLKYYIKKKVTLKKDHIFNKYIQEEANVNQAIRKLNIKGCVIPFAEKTTTETLKLYMEYYPSMELSTIVKYYGSMKESDIRRVFKPAIEALMELNKINIIYRDFEPTNILVGIDPNTKEIEGKLIDFGLAIYVNQEKEAKALMMGTQYFIAPEVISTKYSFNCDIFSIGVTIYYTLLERYPLPCIKGSDQCNYLTNIATIPRDRKLSLAVIDLIQKCLQYDADKRIQTMKDLLAHPFFDPNSTASRTKQSMDYTLSTTAIMPII